MKKIILLSCVGLAFIAGSHQVIAKETSSGSQYKSPGKPAAKIEMDYSVSKERVAVGETVNITLALKGAESPKLADLTTSKQLVLHGEKQISLQKQGNEVSHLFSVTPMTEGIHLITVVAEDASKSHRKPFAIRIVAGDKPIESYLKTNGTLTQDDNGKKIISMSAEER
ncbi:hypothetical protein [Kangiella sediminilitoris]|uniref:Uncharacterized protein n=1 Tax=Kangiella sediminilitoris TaxID=1144748 RepID=A0A1B3B8D7_9GAMM|nr:hypothetical protein [Kangiella sediminilitoris]AOE49031.1 hypothetical protein KS2013_305 [Kangiella sediminilitoris]